MSFNIPFKFYGNYCGPGYSQGEFAKFDESKNNPVDEFDSTCREHDRSYAQQSGYQIGPDWRFFKKNFGKDFKRTVAATGVLLNPFKMSGDTGIGKFINFANVAKGLSYFMPGCEEAGCPGSGRNDKGQGPNGKKQPKTRRGKNKRQIRKNKRQNAGRKPPFNGRMQKSGGYFQPVSAPATKSITIGSLNASSGSIVVRRFEMMFQFVSIVANDFNIVSMTINPGDVSTFPWLSILSQAYDRYEVLEMQFIYRPTCSSSNAGTLALGFDFDADDLQPVNMRSMANQEGFVTGPVWEPLGLTLSKRDVRTRRGLYVSGAIPPTGTDIKTYHLGILNLACQGVAAATTLGDLYVNYVVRLHSPCEPTPPPSTYIIATTGVAPATPMGTGGTRQLPLKDLCQQPPGICYPVSGNERYYIYSTNWYMITFSNIGTTFTATGGINVALNTGIYSNDQIQPYFTGGINSTATQVTAMYVGYLTAGNYLTFLSNVAGCATLTTSYLVMSIIDPAIGGIYLDELAADGGILI